MKKKYLCKNGVFGSLNNSQIFLAGKLDGHSIYHSSFFSIISLFAIK